MIRTALLGAGLVLVAVLVAVTFSPVLDVDRVTVTGAGHTAAADVRRAAGLEHGDLMLDLDEADVRREVAELPWVRRVAVARSWPGTVRLEVTERTPVAWVGGAGDRYALLDASGRVLARRQGPAPGVVRLAGVRPGRPGDLLAGHEGALEVAAAIEGALGLYVGAIETRADGLELVLWTGGRVRFGAASEVAEKLDAILAVLPTTKPASDGACPLLDVRVPRAPVLTEEGRCA